ncbi:MAG: hypothetical protein Q9195_001840 [Heterodermia aff. obscurata]
MATTTFGIEVSTGGRSRSYTRNTVVELSHVQTCPIIRINPHEIHINDLDFVDEVYTNTARKRDKYKWTTRAGYPNLGSVLLARPHDTHRMRRTALNPYFSKASVNKLETINREKVSTLLERFEKHRALGNPIALSIILRALTSDIINEYAFGSSGNNLDRDDYNASFYESIAAFFEVAPAAMHCGWLGPVLDALPSSLMVKLSPAIGTLYQMRKVWETQIEKIRIAVDMDDNESTIFHGVLNSDLPDFEKTTGRLRQEAELIVMAGVDTTASTLSAIIYHLLADPKILGKLRAELLTAIPDPTSPPRYPTIEALPYLTAVIQEGLRLHPAGTLRMTRVAPLEDLIYIDRFNGKKWRIPAGTPISMTAKLLHQIKGIWGEDANDYRPERWLGEEGKGLGRYLMTFGKGTRSCLGYTYSSTSSLTDVKRVLADIPGLRSINLAYQELYLVLSGIFRVYDVASMTPSSSQADSQAIEITPKDRDGASELQGRYLALFDTVRRRDVDLVHDMMIPAAVKGSQGVRVMVL